MTTKNITAEQAQTIKEHLWQTEHDTDETVIYAVLDGARDNRIHKMVRESGLRNSCLYDGELNYELTVAAPYLVRLEKDDPFVIQLLQHSWGNSWGIFIISDNQTTLLSVRRNCKKLAFVKTEKNKKLLFRYYDPRVLRTFLPTCKEDELKQIFGSLRCFLTEDQSGKALHCFSQKDSGFKQRKIKLLPESVESITV